VPFGSQVSNVQHYYHEQYVDVGLGQPMGNNSTWDVALSAMTMPWAGDILAEGYFQIEYSNSYTGIEIWPVTPIGPSNFFAGKVAMEDRHAGWFLIPFFGRWAGLAAGTYFQYNLQVRVLIANGTVTVRRYIGSIRAQGY
jgi:hypothetical protein